MAGAKDIQIIPRFRTPTRPEIDINPRAEAIRRAGLETVDRAPERVKFDLKTSDPRLPPGTSRAMLTKSPERKGIETGG